MELDERIIQYHQQMSECSCIPMVVELILKLLHRVPLDYCELQGNWNDVQRSDFSYFDGRIENGVKFIRQFSKPRDVNFPLGDLFAAIEDELKDGRYVAIALEVDTTGITTSFIISYLAANLRQSQRGVIQRGLLMLSNKYEK